MSSFFWASGHLAWGFFSLVVFTGLWWLLTDLVWRLMDIRIHRLMAMMACGWVAGAALILATFHFFNA